MLVLEMLLIHLLIHLKCSSLGILGGPLDSRIIRLSMLEFAYGVPLVLNVDTPIVPIFAYGLLYTLMVVPPTMLISKCGF